MIENYSSGNTKIREKSSIHMRQKFMFYKFSDGEFLRTKIVLPALRVPTIVTCPEQKICSNKSAVTCVSRR
jgi:hypothetical protein